MALFLECREGRGLVLHRRTTYALSSLVSLTYILCNRRAFPWLSSWSAGRGGGLLFIVELCLVLIGESDLNPQ